MALDKASLLKPVLPSESVPFRGGEVVVQALSRAKVLELRELDLSTAEMDVKILSAGMLDPGLTEDEVRELQCAVLTDELEPLTNKIIELSGLVKGADKTAASSFPDSSGESV